MRWRILAQGRRFLCCCDQVVIWYGRPNFCECGAITLSLLVNATPMRHDFSTVSATIRTLTRPLVVCIVTVLASACANPDVQRAGIEEVIWDVAANHAISADLLVERSRAVDFVLLGETHDNPVHHRIQNWLLRKLSSHHERVSVVMEQYDFEQQAAIDTAMAADTGALQQLKQIMATGWNWSQYQPLVATAKDRHLPLIAANLSRNRLQQVSRKGFAALGAGESSRLRLDDGWTAAQETQLEQDIVDGHCGMLPATAAAAVARAQRARDAMMADALLQVHSGGAVAIFGREHVRQDLAVPLYLAARAPDRRSIVIGLIDSDGHRTPQQEATGTLGPRYDYLILTKPVQRDVDPCEGLVMPIATPN